MSQAGILKVADSILPPDVPTSFVTDSGTATPIGNVIEIFGGAGVTTSAPGSTNIIQITGTSTGFTWNVVTSASPTNPVQLVAENGYICSGAILVTFLLPLTPTIGDTFKIFSYTSRFQIIPNGSQQMTVGAITGVTGASGTVTSNSPGDMVTFTYMGGNVFQSEAPQGTLTIVYA